MPHVRVAILRVRVQSRFRFKPVPGERIRSDETESRPIVVVAMLVGAIVGIGVIVWVVGAWQGFRPDPDARSNLIDLLGTLFLLAVFVERTQEVFVATWRSIGRARIKDEIASIDDEIANFPDTGTPEELKTLQANRRAAATRFSEYRFETRKRTFLLGVVIGTLIALFSQTVLSVTLIVDQNACSDAAASSGACAWFLVFRALDIFLTGLLIGGGSEAIHKVIALFLDYTQRLRPPPAGATAPKPGSAKTGQP